MHRRRADDRRRRSLTVSAGAVSHVDALLHDMAPAMVDFELRSLPAHADQGACLLAFLAFIEAGLRSQRAVDAYEAYLNVFLKAHGDAIAACGPAAATALRRLLATHGTAWSRLHERLCYCLCVTDFLRSPTL